MFIKLIPGRVVRVIFSRHVITPCNLVKELGRQDWDTASGIWVDWTGLMLSLGITFP